VIAGVVKAFNIGFDCVLYEMSYANLMLFSSVLPDYSVDRDKKNAIDGDDPKNFDKILAICRNNG